MNQCNLIELYADIDGVKIPLDSFSLDIALNAYPKCTIGVLAGSDPSAEADIDLACLTAGATATVYLVVSFSTLFDQHPMVKRLFKGIIDSVSTSMGVAASTVSDKVTATLRSLTETANAIPLVDYSYMTTDGKILPYVFMPESDNLQDTTPLAIDYQNNTPKAVLDAIGSYCTSASGFIRAHVSKDAIVSSISDYVDLYHSDVSMVSKPSDGTPKIVNDTIKKLLTSQTPLQVWAALMTKQFMLTVYPYIRFDIMLAPAIQMAVAYLPAWSRTAVYDITKTDCMSLQSVVVLPMNPSSTSSDVIAVAFEPVWKVDEKDGASSLQYVYYGEQGELSADTVGAMFAENTLVNPCRLSVQRLPQWLVPGGYGAINNEHELAEMDVKNIALNYAKTYFVTHNRMSRRQRLAVSLETLFAVDKYLGKVITFPAITPDKTEAKMYGQLGGFSLSLKLSADSILTDSFLDIMAVRTEAENEMYGIDDELIYKVKK